MTWRVGYPDGSGPEHIVDEQGQPVAALRWGCGCCQNRSPLTADEKRRARVIAQAPAMVADFAAIALNKPPLGSTFEGWVRAIARRHLDATKRHDDADGGEADAARRILARDEIGIEPQHMKDARAVARALLRGRTDG